jgi:hypothetical protein
MLLKEENLLFTRVEYYNFYFGMYVIITCIIAILLMIALIYSKFNRGLKSIIYENKIFNKNNGDIISINDSNDRENIIKGYKNITKINFTLFIYLTLIVLFIIFTLHFYNFIGSSIHGETKTGIYIVKEKINVVGSLISFYIGIISIVFNKILVESKRNIENKFYKVRANGV